MTPGVTGDGSGSAMVSSSSAATTNSASGSKGSSDGGGGAATSSSSAAMKKGPWTATEDGILMEYVRKQGEGNWNAVQKNSGLSRCGKSCRLRWANHLRPNLKKGPFSPDEERLILELHSKMGNKWARMAAQLPGRTDNEIKNYWNTRIKRRQRAGLPLYPPDIQHQATLNHRPCATGGAPAPPPLSDHKTLYSTSIGATPLSLFDTINFSATPAPPQAAAMTPMLGLGHHHPPPFLVAPSAGAAGHQQRAKRFREDDVGSFSLPFTTNSLAPPSQTPLFQQLNYPGGYVDLNPSPPPQHQQQQQQSFSVKMELPSSQLFPEPSRAVPGGGGGGLPLGRSNAELLDALLRDTHAMGGGEGNTGNGGAHHGIDGLLTEGNPEDAKWVKGNGGGDAGGELSQGLLLGTAGSKWDGLNHLHPMNAVLRREAAEDAGSVEDDLSALFDLIPMAAAAAAAAPREWYNSNNSGEVEVSNGQSSGVTDDNVGLEMQQLASSLSMAAEDHNWSDGTCHWHGMPGTC